MAAPFPRKDGETVERDRPASREHGRATWPAVEAGPPPVLLVPVGSCEQHGPHLPLDTDTRIAVAVATAVAEEETGVVVAPAVAYGSSGEHQSFAGTLSVGTAALRSLLVELGRSAFPAGEPSPYRAAVLVNGHGGNLAAVDGAVADLVAEGRPVGAWHPAVPDGDAHAGRTETSLLLAIAPELVGPERPVGVVDPVAALYPAMRDEGVGSISPTGVLGDATGASAAEGRALLADLVASCRAVVAAAAS